MRLDFALKYSERNTDKIIDEKIAKQKAAM